MGLFSGLFGKKKPPKHLKDKHLNQPAQSLGGTTANEVYKTSYKNKKGFEGSNTGYFKEDTPDTVSKYAVGASSLAKGMGFGGLIPETKFATHSLTDRYGNQRDKVTGAVSAGAPGESLMENVFDTDVHNTFTQQMAGKSDDEVDFGARVANYKNVGGRWMGHSGDEINDIDLSNPTTQKGLNDLQWFDSLIGNADRHGGNILVDPATGQVSGIDNDLSFGTGQFAKMGKNVDEDFVKGRDAKYLGLPSMLDKSTAEKLMALDDKKLAKMLNPKGTPKDQKFTEKELQQTYDRLEVIKAKVQEMTDNDELVDQWDDSTYQKAINEDTSGRATSWNKDPYGSYVQRQHKQLEEARDTGKGNMWRKGHRTADTTPAPQPPQPAQPPARTPPPVPDRTNRPALSQPGNPPQTRTRSGSDTPIPSLEDTVANSPWADQMMRRKQPV